MSFLRFHFSNPFYCRSLQFKELKSWTTTCVTADHFYANSLYSNIAIEVILSVIHDIPFLFFRQTQDRHKIPSYSFQVYFLQFWASLSEKSLSETCIQTFGGHTRRLWGCRLLLVKDSLCLLWLNEERVSQYLSSPNRLGSLPLLIIVWSFFAHLGQEATIRLQNRLQNRRA